MFCEDKKCLNFVFLSLSVEISDPWNIHSKTTSKKSKKNTRNMLTPWFQIWKIRIDEKIWIFKGRHNGANTHLITRYLPNFSLWNNHTIYEKWIPNFHKGDFICNGFFHPKIFIIRFISFVKCKQLTSSGWHLKEINRAGTISKTNLIE